MTLSLFVYRWRLSALSTAVLALVLGCQPAPTLSPIEEQRGEDDGAREQSRQPTYFPQEDRPVGENRPADVTPSGPGYVPPVGGSRGVTEFSNGSGGVKGQVAPQRFAQNGEFIVWAPTDNAPAPGPSHGLLVLLHGSNTSNYTSFLKDSGRNAMLPVARKHNLIAVSVRAPNGQGWNEGNQVANAEYLHNLVQQTVYSSYNVDKRRVYFSGQSSGGGFLSSHFVPVYVNQYKGGAFFQCGMTRPDRSASLSPSVDAKKNFRVHMEITRGDGIWTSSFPGALSSYQAAGLQVSSDNSKSGSHCDFDQAQIIDRYLPNWNSP